MSYYMEISSRTPKGATHHRILEIFHNLPSDEQLKSWTEDFLEDISYENKLQFKLLNSSGDTVWQSSELQGDHYPEDENARQAAT